MRLHEFGLRQGALSRASDLSAATADLLRALDAAGIEVILLKGPVTAAWLYATAEIPRAYADVVMLWSVSIAALAMGIWFVFFPSSPI